MAKTTTKTTRKKPVRINWTSMLTDPWTLAQAAQRMQQQCPMTQKVQCIHMPDPEVDPVLEAWIEKQPKYEAPAGSEPANEPGVIKPVPSFEDIVRQHQQPAEAALSS